MDYKQVIELFREKISEGKSTQTKFYTYIVEELLSKQPDRIFTEDEVKWFSTWVDVISGKIDKV
jgi:hypothetical protein